MRYQLMPCPPRSRGPLRWAAVLSLAAIGVAAARPAEAADQPAVKPAVRIVIDYADGVEKHFTRIPWRQGMTVLDALTEASQHPRGIRFEHRGSGATAFVYRIDDLENQGRGLNWVFSVNGKLADRGCGVFQLKARDNVVWKFDKYR